MYFTGIGTVVNVILVLVGALLGLALGRHFPQRISTIVTQASGLAVLFVGLSGLLSAVFSVEGSTLNTSYSIMIIVCMIIGSIIGELLNIDGALQKAGNWLQNKLQKNKDGKKSLFAEGFCHCTILFCSGAMAIVGSFNDALLQNPDVLYSKAFIDGMMSIVFASTMGVGVLFSAVSVGLYQGAFTALATLLMPLLTDPVIAQMSAIGSLIIIGIGLNLLQACKLRIANLLPAMFLPLVWQLITRLIG